MPQPCTKRDMEMLCQNANACIRFACDPRPLSESQKRVFRVLCHETLEQTLYDAFLYGVREEEIQRVDSEEALIEKAAKLYYVQGRLEARLECRNYDEPGQMDAFLLRRILSEVKKRRPEARRCLEAYLEAQHCTRDEGHKYFAKKIYQHYLSVHSEGWARSMTLKSVADEYDDFPSYLQYLLTLNIGDTGIEIKNEYNLRSMITAARRNSTFLTQLPHKDELYMFCISAAFDDYTFLRLQKLVLREIRLRREQLPEGNKKRKELDRAERSYQGHDKRDDVLLACLREMKLRLETARYEVGDRISYIPSTILTNVNRTLAYQKLRQFLYCKV